MNGHPLNRRSGRLDARRDGANEHRAMTRPQPPEARAFATSPAFSGTHPDPLSSRHREIVESVLARRLSANEIEAIAMVLRLRHWDRPDAALTGPVPAKPERPSRPSVLDLGDD